MKQLVFILVILSLNSCTKHVFKSKWTNEKAPNIFVARFETTKGSFDVEVNRSLSPYAVDRVYQLVRHHFYDNSIFYRADSNFIVQFGTSDTIKMNKWMKYQVPDEIVIGGNKKGTISFGRAGKETRGRELVINLNDNKFLDTLFYGGVKGFPTFGNVIGGMEVVESIYCGYGDNTMDKLDALYSNRSKFLHVFPKLDLVTKAYILK